MRVDAESESGAVVVIVKSDPGETVGMTRDRAYFLTKNLSNSKDNWKVANSASRVAVWQKIGCEYGGMALLGSPPLQPPPSPPTSIGI